MPSTTPIGRSLCELPTLEAKKPSAGTRTHCMETRFRRHQLSIFSGLEKTRLKTSIHPDIVEYFSSFWSSTIEGKSIEGTREPYPIMESGRL